MSVPADIRLTQNLDPSAMFPPWFKRSVAFSAVTCCGESQH